MPIETPVEPLSRQMMAALLSEQEGMCLSLYQSTHRHHPENVQDPIRFKNLLKTLDASLHDMGLDADLRALLLKPFRALESDIDFWRHTQDGIAVLGTQDAFHVFNLQHPVPDFVGVAESWHLKPLLRALQASDRFQVLCLTREWIRLYEGNHDVMDEVTPAEGVPRTIEDALGTELTEPYLKVARYGMGPSGAPGKDMRHGHGDKKDALDSDEERFFRAVDKAVLEKHSRVSELPLILVALPEYQSLFRQLSHNEFLLPGGVAVDPGALQRHGLRSKVWEVMASAQQQRISELAAVFIQASAKGRGSELLDDAVDAALAGRIDILLLDADRRIAGQIDVARRTVQLKDDSSGPNRGDVLDDIAEIVIRQGGKAMVIPHAHMPCRTGLAAIYRY